MITFFSNFINSHQIPFCNAMYEKTNGEFRFVATEPIWQERLNLGFQDESDKYPYVIKAFECPENHKEAIRLGASSDVAIIGSAPDEFIEDRLRENKLTFRYCERFFKQGKWRILDPRVLWHHYTMNFRYRNKALYMLCASAYTATDCQFIHSYKGKTYKWGYFPRVKVRSWEELSKCKQVNEKVSILWAGRLIEWKHPELPVLVAEELKKQKISFDLNIIGDGTMREFLQAMIAKKGLEDYVQLLGAMPTEQVLEYMALADIFLFTSDRQEGWGAVLNEALTSGCAVVACKEIGSVPYLIEDGINGFIYEKKEKGLLYRKVRQLIDDTEMRSKMQFEAYQTMRTVWNADVAAERLLNLIDCIEKGKAPDYQSGPCSRD